MKIESAGCTMKGAVRLQNEDTILLRSDKSCGLFLVADGIGGCAYGAEASGIVRDGFDDWWSNRNDKASFLEAADSIKMTLHRLNNTIFTKFGRYGSGTTVVFLYIQGDDCLWLSSGDSRIYLARGSSFSQITRDDIFENLLEKPQGLGEENNGKLVGAVGIGETLDYTMRIEPLHRGDRFLLCSDGVYKYHSISSLRKKMMLQGCFCTSKAVVRNISDAVEKNGSGDNYSMVFVRVR